MMMPMVTDRTSVSCSVTIRRPLSKRFYDRLKAWLLALAAEITLLIMRSAKAGKIRRRDVPRRRT